MKNHKTVLIEVHTSFAARYLLRTDIFRKLREAGINLVILSPYANEPYFQEEFNAPNIHHEKIASTEIGKFMSDHAGLRWMRQVRIYALGKSKSVDFQFKKYISENVLQGVPGMIIMAVTVPLVYCLRVSSGLRKAFIAIESYLYSGEFYNEMLNKWKPDLVITPSLGYFNANMFLIRQARKMGISVMAVILSWDNTSTKGIAGAFADHIVAWTDIMKEELETWHDIPANRIFVGGIAHYDRYFDKDYIMTRSQLANMLHIPETANIVLFGVGMPVMFHDLNKEVIDVLGRAADNKEFNSDVHIVVRLHPNYWMASKAQQDNAALAKEIEDLCGNYKTVIINRPVTRTFENPSVPYDLYEEDQVNLASLLKHSVCVVSEFSTLMLEASIFDVPSVNAAFDRPNERLGISQTEVKEFAHLKRIMDTGGSPIAETPEELIDMINNYIQRPETDRSGRKLILSNECGPNRGSAGENIANHILEILAK